ncbi:MAG TPA: FKBP-type peptidyl-prolyl cis-trans isomerase [Nitrospiraceae bacterium]|nr:FKBP-type peptidyl-prolyl cis-trans isomerase [Nitrospiraceae bacterium]
MGRHDYTKASLIVSLACMTLLGGYVLGAKPPQASSSRSSEVESSRIVEGSLVTLKYVATVLGSTGIDYGNISEYIQSRREIVRALEQEIVGMKPGESKKVELSPEEGFGIYDDGKKMIVRTTLLPTGAKKGDIIQNALGDLATVVEVVDATAVLDHNHPLAGKPLVVQMKILKIENP